jgi:indole-3-acetate monooxygenase
MAGPVALHHGPVMDAIIGAGSKLGQAARALGPLILACRDATEAERMLPAQLVDALVEGGLFHLATAAADGGVEAAPVDALEAYEELAAAEASVAWIVWNNSLPALASKFLSAGARRALFAPRNITANSTRPTGRATESTDGFRISGRWSLVSGCGLADNLLLRCVVSRPGDPPGPPELAMAFVPRAAVRIVDTWHVGGLRGTGSHDVIVENALVPRAHILAFGPSAELDTALHRMPFAATLSAGCAAIALGIARGSIGTIFDLVRDKTSVDTGAALRDKPDVQRALARMKASHAAARLLLHSAVDATFHACARRESVTLEGRAEIWSAANHAAATAKQIVRAAYDLAGASALYVSCPLERAHRDLHAVCQHVILQDTWLEDAGRVWLGAPPTAPMFAS